MLKKGYRLSSFLLGNPKLVKAKYFNLKFSKNKTNVSKFAFVVSKKVDARSTKRNEIKRKVRAAVEEARDKITGGYDFIFYPSKAAMEVSSKEVAGELIQVLRKENLLNE